MCEVPSWLKHKDGSISYMIDKDLEKHGIPYYDAGHTTLRRFFGDGEHLEAPRTALPPEILTAVKKGQYKKQFVAARVMAQFGDSGHATGYSAGYSIGYSAGYSSIGVSYLCDGKRVFLSCKTYSRDNQGARAAEDWFSQNGSHVLGYYANPQRISWSNHISIKVREIFEQLIELAGGFKSFNA